METQNLEQKTQPIDSISFNSYHFYPNDFEKILTSNNINKTKSDSYYFISNTNNHQEPGQRHVETYYHSEETRNLMKDQELLLSYTSKKEEEWQYDGYDQITSSSGYVELFVEEPLARKIFEQVKDIETQRQIESTNFEKRWEEKTQREIIEFKEKYKK